MKILVFVEKFMSPTLLFIYNEIQELSKTNEVLIVTTEHIMGTATDFPFEHIKVVPFAPGKIEKKIQWLLEKNDIYFTRKNKDFSKKINALIDSFKPDIIHGHFGYESLILLENIISVSCPIFVTFHGYDASEMLQRTCYVKKLNYYFNRFKVSPIYVSDYMLKDLENAGVHLKGARLLYYGTDLNYFKPEKHPKPHDKFTFLQISSFTEKKGHTYTLLAFKKFLDLVENKNHFRLLFAGGGALLEQIKSEAKNIGLVDFVEFTGIVTYKETPPLLQHADTFVHHSITATTGQKEGIPNALMEAMAMELPVISTRHAGIPELVEDGVNGYLVDEKDIDTYALRMKDILTWKRLPINRQKIQDKFSRIVHNKLLLDYYERESARFSEKNKS